MSKRKINVAIIGLGFGAEFIPLWQKHPHADCYAICQRNPEKLHAVGDYFGVPTRYAEFKEVLNDKNVDVVHINSPIPDHAWLSIAASTGGGTIRTPSAAQLISTPISESAVSSSRSAHWRRSTVRSPISSG